MSRPRRRGVGAARRSVLAAARLVRRRGGGGGRRRLERSAAARGCARRCPSVRVQRVQDTSPVGTRRPSSSRCSAGGPAPRCRSPAPRREGAGRGQSRQLAPPSARALPCLVHDPSRTRPRRPSSRSSAPRTDAPSGCGTTQSWETTSPPRRRPPPAPSGAPRGVVRLPRPSAAAAAKAKASRLWALPRQRARLEPSTRWRSTGRGARGCRWWRATRCPPGCGAPRSSCPPRTSRARPSAGRPPRRSRCSESTLHRAALRGLCCCPLRQTTAFVCRRVRERAS